MSKVNEKGEKNIVQNKLTFLTGKNNKISEPFATTNSPGHPRWTRGPILITGMVRLIITTNNIKEKKKNNKTKRYQKVKKKKRRKEKKTIDLRGYGKRKRKYIHSPLTKRSRIVLPDHLDLQCYYLVLDEKNYAWLILLEI